MIQMGNDEFILYIRKWHINCALSNDALGKLIWQRIRELDSEAVKIREDEPVHWEIESETVGPLLLPKTAAQFRFNRNILPALYVYLDELGAAV